MIDFDKEYDEIPQEMSDYINANNLEIIELINGKQKVVVYSSNLDEKLKILKEEILDYYFKFKIIGLENFKYEFEKAKGEYLLLLNTI